MPSVGGGSEQEKFSGQAPRVLSHDEIQEFFDAQHGLLLDGDNKLLLTQRRRLIELLSGNVGLVRFAAKFPIDEENPQIKGGISLFWPASAVEELRNNLPPERPKGFK